MNPVKWLALVILAVFSSALAAQNQDIDVEYPVGTSLTNGQTVNYGKTDNGEAILLTVRIENAGTSDLVIGTPGVTGSAYKNVQVNIAGVPTGATLTPTSFADLSVDINPDKNSDWSFLITITSDDPTDPIFTVRFKGTEGKPKKDEDDCSTSDSSGLSMLMLLGALSAALIGVRLRAARE